MAASRQLRSKYVSGIEGVTTTDASSVALTIFEKGVQDPETGVYISVHQMIC